MEKSYRIKANVGKDQVLNVNFQRDVDFYEILSLKLSQKNLYKLHTSNYGVIVGRVLANDAFGVPNAKVSVFIPIKDEDKLRSDIKELYPYGFVNSYNNENKRFNILPNYPTDACNKPVGSFPSKRNVLDEDILIEIYDKYYKYTTTTNDAGDYMIFGVPTGVQVVHTDIDLSDIGVLSQRPTDFIYKGYDLNLFESPSEFKQSTNLDELPQIISENTSVNVYPLWGDKNENEIAITRNDVRIQYKFEPTCVFLGSVVTDSSVNSISHECVASSKMGEASQLDASEGTIEMIRKTIFDKVEEFSIKGNQLIDGNGIWCYQIPMNLDYVCTDEYGNIAPTDNPNKGIPTRARVRFRVTLNESDNESISSHKARYLIPNNPPLLQGEGIPYVNKKCLDDKQNNDSYYEFGTLTNDDCFRDLLWNKVYSVKSYIPRVQKDKSYDGEKNVECIAIKGVNKKNAGGINPFPFNKLNLNFSLPFYYLLWEYEWDGGDLHKFWDFLTSNQKHYTTDASREKMMEEMDAIGLDFYNDWINGCLYFPNWYWYLREKKDYNGENDSRYDSQFCDCDSKVSDKEDNKLCIFNNCSLPYENEELKIPKAIGAYKDFRDIVFDTKLYTKFNLGSQYFENGIIKKKKNKYGASLYYYSFGQPIYPEKTSSDGTGVAIARLFATDIILLGSLVDTDIHGIPKMTTNLPSTTCIIPPIGKAKPDLLADGDNTYEETADDIDKSTVNGMHWGRYWDDDTNVTRDGTGEKSYRYKYGSGLFFGIVRKSFWVFVDSLVPYTDIKTCVNAERICELGVTNDSNAKAMSMDGKEIELPMDGFITRKEILDTNSRSLFATLNSDKMITTIETDATGYKTYNLKTFYQHNFDGRLEKATFDYTSGETRDSRCKDYIDFRFNSITNDISIYEDYTYGNGSDNTTNLGGKRLGGQRTVGTRGGTRDGYFIGYRGTIKVGENKRHFYSNDKNVYSFPLYENSFYFYFGINSGHNAISEFYKNFMGKCNTNDTESIFSVTITTKPSTICGTQKAGEIQIVTNGLVYPYSVTVTDDIGNKKEKKDLYYPGVTIDGLSNGEYLVTVVDDIGQKKVKTVKLKQEKINSNYTVTDIDAETHKGNIQITSYTLDGVVKDIESFTNHSIEGNNLVISVDDKCTITIRLKSGESVSEYLCETCIEGNQICFKKKNKDDDYFIIKTQQNGEGCSEINYTEEKFDID